MTIIALSRFVRPHVEFFEPPHGRGNAGPRAANHPLRSPVPAVPPAALGSCMPSQPSPPASITSSRLPRGAVCAALLALAAGAGLMVWANQDLAPAQTPAFLLAEFPTPDDFLPPRHGPPPPPETMGGPVYSVVSGQENGAAVLKIQVVAGEMRSWWTRRRAG